MGDAWISCPTLKCHRRLAGAPVEIDKILARRLRRRPVRWPWTSRRPIPCCCRFEIAPGKVERVQVEGVDVALCRISAGGLRSRWRSRCVPSSKRLGLGLEDSAGVQRAEVEHVCRRVVAGRVPVGRSAVGRDKPERPFRRESGRRRWAGRSRRCLWPRFAVETNCLAKRNFPFVRSRM